jgi:hypothetical protein
VCFLVCEYLGEFLSLSLSFEFACCVAILPSCESDFSAKISIVVGT